MDIDDLMTRQGMRTFTDEQRDTFVNDAVQLRQMAQIIQARLANTQIDGDSAGTAARRARKVVRRWQRIARLLEKAAAETEAANAVYLREVLELPERRAQQAQNKALRKQRLGIAAGAAQDAVQQSLAQSAHALNGPPTVGDPQVNTVAEGPRYVHPQPWNYQPTAGGPQGPQEFADFFAAEGM
ncbi:MULTISPECIES: hypothetical protein [unclassified Streptomyces]|uniref:hypothetical protein n=1 Tax=unclassified Streptomyces TaxID=2593676 RepID=UPI0036EDCEF8